MAKNTRTTEGGIQLKAESESFCWIRSQSVHPALPERRYTTPLTQFTSCEFVKRPRLPIEASAPPGRLIGRPRCTRWRHDYMGSSHDEPRPAATSRDARQQSMTVWAESAIANSPWKSASLSPYRGTVICERHAGFAVECCAFASRRESIVVVCFTRHRAGSGARRKEGERDRGRADCELWSCGRRKIGVEYTRCVPVTFLFLATNVRAGSMTSCTFPDRASWSWRIPESLDQQKSFRNCPSPRRVVEDRTTAARARSTPRARGTTYWPDWHPDGRARKNVSHRFANL